MKRLIVGLVVVMLFLIDVFATSEIVDKTLAIVNKEPIFISEFNDILSPILEQYKRSVPIENQTEQEENKLRSDILDQKITDVLLKQEIKKQKIKISKKELQDAINKIKGGFANELDFVAELKRKNITFAEFEKKINDQILFLKLRQQEVETKIKSPTENEAKALYDKIIIKIKGEKTKSTSEDESMVISLADIIKEMLKERVKLREILIICPQSATTDKIKIAEEKIAIIKKELQNQSFGDVAARHSENTISRSRNGDLGTFSNGNLIPAINKIVFSMEVGSYTKNPIKTDIGYHFLKIDEKCAKKDIPSFNEIKDDIVEILRMKNARQIYIDYINGLKSKSNIKINKIW